MMESLSEIHDGEELCTLSANALKHVFYIKKRPRFGFSKSIEVAIIDTHTPFLSTSMRLGC